MAYHPDLNDGCKNKAASFQEVSKAYRVLSNERKRDQYDREMGFIRRVRQSPYSGARFTGAAHHQHQHQRYDGRGNPAQYGFGYPPPGGGVNQEMWNAWHHGDNATNTDPIQRRNSFFKGTGRVGAYYQREMQREFARMAGAGEQPESTTEHDPHKAQWNKKKAVKERMRLRREQRGSRGSIEDEYGSSGCVVC
uniref:J domain-containing protein n=1 Tax=Fibrocapsa japonica TaxID=94617 RepID=A0A7S2UZ81_9STRA|mmetsp:Transcript_20585/g.29789  ORF Transcript_20585/g.29789 Transcript_20585/m.29789 type:complete len:194 (+) Transcript_20585:147-728(+)